MQQIADSCQLIACATAHFIPRSFFISSVSGTAVPKVQLTLRFAAFQSIPASLQWY